MVASLDTFSVRFMTGMPTCSAQASDKLSQAAEGLIRDSFCIISHPVGSYKLFRVADEKEMRVHCSVSVHHVLCVASLPLN